MAGHIRHQTPDSHTNQHEYMDLAAVFHARMVSYNPKTRTEQEVMLGNAKGVESKFVGMWFNIVGFAPILFSIMVLFL